MKYRSRFEIASTILTAALEGNATKTRLMYGSFLSFAQINEYLAFLLGNTLISKNEETRMYALTEKGMRFLRVYEELTKLVPTSEPVAAT
jgi:predicted transcriptional regulator